MMQKRLRQLVIGGVVPAALAVGGSASAGAATGNGGAQWPAASLRAGHRVAEASVAAPTGLCPASVGAANRVCERASRELRLTDHEQYVRHHQRLAAPTSSGS